MMFALKNQSYRHQSLSRGCWARKTGVLIENKSSLETLSHGLSVNLETLRHGLSVNLETQAVVFETIVSE